MRQRLRLAALSGLSMGLLLALVALFGLFRNAQLALNNVYFVPSPTSNRITLVALDDASFATYGRSPADWPRQAYARLVEQLNRAGARVIAFDLIFSEPSTDDRLFAEALLEARNNTTRSRLVLAGAGINAPSAQAHNSTYPRNLTYATGILPVPNLRVNADYIGAVNAFPDVDSALRRQVSIVTIATQDYPSFALAAYLAYLRVPSAAWPQVISATPTGLQFPAALQLDTDASGLWLQNYFGQPYRPDASTFPVLSAQDVIAGRFEAALIADRIVLVGVMNATAATDEYLTPVSLQGNLMAGVEIQANAIESLLQNRLPSTAPLGLELLLIVLLAVFSSLISARAHWPWKLFITALLLLLLLLLAFVAFAIWMLMVSLLYLMLALTLPPLVNIGLDASRERQLRTQSRREQQALSERNAALAERNEALEALNKLKTHMLRMASHDLKNPLGRINGYAELITMDSEGHPTLQKYVNHIKSATEEMLALISDLLNLEQIRSSNLTFEAVEMVKLISDLLGRFEPDCQLKQQQLERDLPPAPLIIHGDYRQLSQAISNLLSNAVKYTPEGGRVRLSLRDADEQILVVIADTGYGIPEEAQAKLFTEFYRVKTRDTIHISGTGLGLSLVKSVVEAHHGDIHVHSAVGQGSTFTLHLPKQPKAT